VQRARSAAVDGRLSLIGLVAGALLVAGLATPALAATEAGRLAVPHGEHGDTSVGDTVHDHDDHHDDHHSVTDDGHHH